MSTTMKQARTLYRAQNCRTLPVAYDSAGQPTAFEKVFTPGGLRAWARREYRPGTDASPKLASLLQV